MQVSSLKTSCTTFGVKNAMKIAFRRRNSYNRTEITLWFRQNRVNGYDLRAAVPLAGAKNGVHYIRCVKCNVNSAQTGKFHHQKRNSSQFTSKSCKWLRFASCSACFEKNNAVHYVRRVKCNENSFETSKFLQQKRNNAQFSSKSRNGCDLHAALLVSKIITLCITFGV